MRGFLWGLPSARRSGKGIMMMAISRVAHHHCLLLIQMALSGSLVTVWGIGTDEWPSKDKNSVKTELTMNQLS